MAFHIKWKVLCISLFIALGIGFLSSFFTNSHMVIYAQLNKPFLAPPGFLFPIVWTGLYILMGISSYLVYLSKDYTKQAALYMYATQLAVNFLWPIVFFCIWTIFFSFSNINRIMDYGLDNDCLLSFYSSISRYSTISLYPMVELCTVFKCRYRNF